MQVVLSLALIFAVASIAFYVFGDHEGEKGRGSRERMLAIFMFLFVATVAVEQFVDWMGQSG